MSYPECFKQTTARFDKQPPQDPAAAIAYAQPLAGPDGGDLHLFQCAAYEGCTFSCGTIMKDGLFKVLASRGACLQESTIEVMATEFGPM